MSKAKFLKEMVQEMEARKNPLLAEKKQLLKATTRIAEIDQLVEHIDEEMGEVKAKIHALEPVDDTTKEKAE